jgi:hypothetical protein
MLPILVDFFLGGASVVGNASPNISWLPADDPLPKRMAILPNRLGDFFADPTAAWFLNDPHTLNPASIPSWLPDDKPRPRVGPSVQKAQDWCEVSNFLPVIPAEVNAGELIDDWCRLPLRPRPQTIKAQDFATPTVISVAPVVINSAALLDTAPALPRSVPRLPIRLIETFADPTGAWFIPGNLPPGFPSWMLQDPYPTRIAFLPVHRQYADASIPVKAPDINVAQYQLGQQPIQFPRPVPILTIRMDQTEVIDWSYVAQAQAWDQPAGIPRVVPRWNLDPSPTVGKIFPPADALTSVIGWLQEVAVLPRPVPKANLGESVAFVDPQAAYDPQSLRVPLHENPGFPYYPRPKLNLYADPDQGGWLYQAVIIAADTHPAAWAETPAPLPRPRPKTIPGDFAFCLTTSQEYSALLPWTDPATLPRRIPTLFQTGSTDYPPFYESVTIIVSGPYYAIAKQVQNAAFAVAGQIITS